MMPCLLPACLATPRAHIRTGGLYHGAAAGWSPRCVGGRGKHPRTLLFWAPPFSYMSKNDPFCQDRLGTDQQHAHRLVTRVCLLPAAGGGFVLPDSGSRLRKQLLLPLCILKMIILPRQARDKHSAKHPKQDYGLLAEIRPTGEENLAATLVYGELLLEAHSNRQGQKQQH